MTTKSWHPHPSWMSSGDSTIHSLIRLELPRSSSIVPILGCDIIQKSRLFPAKAPLSSFACSFIAVSPVARSCGVHNLPHFTAIVKNSPFTSLSLPSIHLISIVHPDPARRAIRTKSLPSFIIYLFRPQGSIIQFLSSSNIPSRSLLPPIRERYRYRNRHRHHHPPFKHGCPYPAFVYAYVYV